MSTFFVKDIYLLSHFFSEKKTFYSTKEKKLNLWLLFSFLFAICLLSSQQFFVIFSESIYLFSNFTLLIAFLGVVFLYQDRLFALRFLPLVFWAIINFFFQAFHEYFPLQLVNNFGFLFSFELAQKVSNNEYLFLGKSIVWTFFRNCIRTVLLLFFLFLNFDVIKKVFLNTWKDKNLTLLSFFLLLMVFNIVNHGTTFGFFANSKVISQNQRSINAVLNSSSYFHSLFYYFAIVVITPFWEELIFRYALFAVFGRRNVFWAVAFSIFLFATIHYSPDDFKAVNGLSDFLQTIFSSQLIAYLYGSVILSYMFWIYDLNLFFPIFFHSIWNFTASFIF